MGYGLKIKNDGLGLQIDSLYVNYALWDHGENVSTYDQGGAHGAEVSFASVAPEPPLIAIKPSSSRYCGLSHYLKSGSNYSGFVLMSEDAVTTIDWQAFVPRKDKSSESYGLRVYAPSTDLVFDSGHRPMIISDVDTCSPPYNGQVNVTHPSDANAYFIMSPHGFWQWIGGWNGYISEVRNYLPMFKYVSATQVSFGGVMFSQGAIPAPISFSDGYWPSIWTIITTKKAF